MVIDAVLVSITQIVWRRCWVWVADLHFFIRYGRPSMHRYFGDSPGELLNSALP